MDNVYAISFCLFSMLLQCDNIIILNEKGIGPQVLSSIILIFYYLFTIVRYKGKNNIIQLAPYILYSVFLLYLIFTYPGGAIPLNMIQIIVYLICSYALFNMRGKISQKKILRIITMMIWFVIIIGPIQFLCSSMLLPKIILQPFLFNDSLSGVNVQYYYPFPYLRLFSTFMEPSFCSTFLVGSIIFVLHIGKKNIKHFNLLLSLLIGELILTFSSTGYGGFLIMMALYFAKNLKRRYMQYMITFIFFGLIFYSLFGDTVLREVLFEKMSSSSASARTWWNIAAMEAFNNHPIIGAGFQSVRASSYLYTLLGETGIVGTLIYFLFFVSLYWPIFFKNNNDNREEDACRYYMLSVVVCMIIACPDHNMCTFWIGFYMFSLLSVSNMRNRLQQVTKLLIRNKKIANKK